MDALLAALAEYVSSSQLLIRFSVSALTLVVYDYFLTFEKEKRYVWSSTWTTGTVLFLAIRYLPFIDLSLIIWDQSTMNASEGICTAVIWWYQFSCIVALVLSDWVIGLRTWGIWGRGNVCAVLVGVAWVGATASSLYFQVKALREDIYYPLPAGVDIPGCTFFTTNEDTLTNMYTVYAVYQTLIFIATVVRGIGHLRYSPGKVTSVIYRDAFLTSTTLFGLAILNIVTLKVSPAWSYGLTSLYRAMNAVLPERIILNLREASMTPNADGWLVTTADPMADAGSGLPSTARGIYGSQGSKGGAVGLECEMSVMHDVA